MKSKRQSIAITRNSIKETNMSNRKQSIYSNNPMSRKTTNLGLQNQETLSCDLLLNLYNLGMYDPQNPSHQRGTVV